MINPPPPSEPPKIRTVRDFIRLKLTPNQNDLFSRSTFQQTDEITALAKDFQSRYPSEQYTVAAFGRSPLFFLETLDALNSNKTHTIKIAGSGFQDFMNKEIPNYAKTFLPRVLNKNRDEFNKWVQTIEPEKQNPIRALRNNLLIYKTYLDHIDMSPDDIIKRNQEDGRKTVIIDGCKDGTSITMLTAILSNWAIEEGNDKELRDALRYHLFAPEGEPTLTPKRYGFIGTMDVGSKTHAFRELMDSDSMNLGVRLPYQTMFLTKPEQVSKQMKEADRSPIAYRVRALIMIILQKLNLLPEES